MKLYYKSVASCGISFCSASPTFVWQSQIFPEYKIEVWRGVFTKVDVNIEEVTTSTQDYLWDYIWFNYEKPALQKINSI